MLKPTDKLAGLVPADKDWTAALLEMLGVTPLPHTTPQWTTGRREQAHRIAKMRADK